VHFTFIRVVTVTPEHKFFEKKERKNSAQERAERSPGGKPLERLRQEGQQRHTKQCADRVADRPGHHLAAQSVPEQEKRRSREKAAEAAQHAQADGHRVKSHGKS
jgi:hypothetical protein